MTLIYTTIDSPIGELLLLGDGSKLHRLHMQEGSTPIVISRAWRRADGAFGEQERQLREYFGGQRSALELALELHGNPFELRVWEALQRIPYGETRSYGQLARSIGEPDGARAVGRANGRNPVAVVVPCHRVIGADGGLTGYGGGLERKRLLLDLERSIHRMPV